MSKQRYEITVVPDCLRYSDQLWTAPELLRMEHEQPRFGTQAGDIYSFAIICSEVVTRERAFTLTGFNEASGALLCSFSRIKLIDSRSL